MDISTELVQRFAANHTLFTVIKVNWNYFFPPKVPAYSTVFSDLFKDIPSKM